MTKFTPGPWACDLQGYFGWQPRIHSADNTLVAVVGNAQIERQDQWDVDARLIAAAPDLDAAAGFAITALSFAQERYQRDGDELGYAQTTHAKNALINAQNKARGRTVAMRDVTPSRAAIAKATGAP